MYDSDEEDRRRGDKFTRERENRGPERNGNGPPPDPYERRPMKRSYGGPRRDEDLKRSRPDSGDHMLTLRQFCNEQDITTDAPEAAEKYQKYKEEFEKKTRKAFFEAHKGEEWFKEKYDPTNLVAAKALKKEWIQKRIDVYDKLKATGQLDVSLDPKNAKKVYQLVDAVNVALEGGSDEDFATALNQEIPDDLLEEVKQIVGEFPEQEGAVSADSLTKYKNDSILIKNIPPSATKEEIQEVCQRSPGFLRLFTSDAYADQKWARRAYATYKRSVGVRDVCYTLNNIRVKNCELSAIIQKEPMEKIRVAHGLLNHKEFAEKLLHWAVKIVAFFDKHNGMYVPNPDESEEDIKKDLVVGTDLVAISTNPLIEKLRSKVPGRLDDNELMERGSKTPDNTDKIFERDNGVLCSLDEIILYLRIVHSFDLLQYKLFENEDFYPHRCSVITIRGVDPSANEEGMVYVKKGLQRYMENEFNRHLSGVVSVRYVHEEKLDEMGRMNPEDAVEELIKVNTVQLSDEKWLCPLSGKKFKGPDFIRKHIQSKHQDACDTAKQESIFFNNYLADPERPVDRPDEPSDYRPEERERRPGGGRYFSGPGRRDVDRSPRKDFGGPPGGARRPHIAYRDLDAVQDASEVPNVF